MANVSIRFDIPGKRTFSRMWDELAHVPDDLKVPFEKMANQFLRDNEITFEREGPGWQPLAASTIRDRVSHGFAPDPILVRTGRLRNSLTVVNAPDQIRRIQRQAMELGTSVPYAIYHQTGNLKPWRRGETTMPPGTMPPKRPPIMFTQRLRTQWQRTISEYLREQFAIITGGE